jgi:hypothetical protein
MDVILEISKKIEKKTFSRIYFNKNHTQVNMLFS